jgi:hypothetical protein
VVAAECGMAGQAAQLKQRQAAGCTNCSSGREVCVCGGGGGCAVWDMPCQAMAVQIERPLVGCGTSRRGAVL